MATTHKTKAFSQVSNLTIDAVLADMQAWRNNKSNRGETIPDDLWNKIFRLAEIHTSSTIRQVFGISKKQYDGKWQQLSQTASATTTDPLFAEAILAQPNQPPNSHATRQQLQAIKSTHIDVSNILDAHTVIVELIRADGQRMKIHTTTSSFKEIINVFLTAQDTPC